MFLNCHRLITWARRIVLLRERARKKKTLVISCKGIDKAHLFIKVQTNSQIKQTPFHKLHVIKALNLAMKSIINSLDIHFTSKCSNTICNS